MAHLLADRGVPQVLVVRDPSRAPRLPGSSVRVAEYADHAAVRAALAGLRVVFMVSAAEAPDRVDQHRTFVDAAVEAGVEPLVYTSFLGAAPDATFTLGRDHFATEEHIRSTPMAYTFLRDSFYADFLPLMAGEDGVIRGPAGDGRVSAVARDDVADVAVHVLTDPSRHADASYDLTGPEALSLHEVAAVIREVSGRPVSYEPQTLAEAYASRASYGAPDWQVEAWVSTYTSIARGEAATVSDAVPRLTGHPATSLAEVVRRSGP